MTRYRDSMKTCEQTKKNDNPTMEKERSTMAPRLRNKQILNTHPDLPLWVLDVGISKLPRPGRRIDGHVMNRAYGSPAISIQHKQRSGCFMINVG